MNVPLFSIIVLYWNNEKFLPDCLQALADQTCKEFEILLLDNNSPHPLDSSLLKHYPNLEFQLLHSDHNLGFCGGNNLAAKSARGKYLVLLNADAFPEPNWLETILSAIQIHPDAFFASCLLMASDTLRLDGEWNVYHASGLSWRKSHGKSVSVKTAVSRPVFGACGAAAVYPRAAFEAANGFDEDFFAYMEDVDLDFRLHLLGYDCVYLPSAVVRHIGSGSTSPRSSIAVFYGHRNLVWTFIKDMPGILFWALLPWHILANVGYLIAAILMPNGKYLIKAKWEALKSISEIAAKRKEIQKKRRATIREIVKLIDWNPFSPLIKLTFKH